MLTLIILTIFLFSDEITLTSERAVLAFALIFISVFPLPKKLLVTEIFELVE